MSGRPAGGGGSGGGGNLLDALAGPMASIEGPLGDVGPGPQASFNEPVPPGPQTQSAANYPLFTPPVYDPTHPVLPQGWWPEFKPPPRP
jgi:hypothetical protein